MFNPKLSFSIFYALWFGALGIFLPFWPLWLESRGLSGAQIGNLLAAMTVARLVLAPLFAGWADRSGNAVTVVGTLCLCTAAAFSLFPLGVTFWGLMGITLLHGACSAGTVPIVESIAVRGQRAELIDYGRVRVWGSVAFMLVVLGGGVLFRDDERDLIYVTTLVLLIAAALSSWGLPRVNIKPAAEKIGVLSLLRMPGFVVFVLSAGLMQGSHAMSYGFSSLHWERSGLSEATIGFLWSIGVLAEIVLLIWSSRLLRGIRPSTLIVLGALAGMIRWSVLAVTVNPSWLAPAQMLHALTFAFTHLGALKFVSRYIPDHMAASGVTAYSICNAATMAILLRVSGQLFDVMGGTGFFAMTIVAGVSLMGALSLRMRKPTTLEMGFRRRTIH